MAGRPKSTKPRRVRLVTTVSVDTMEAIMSIAEQRSESRGQVVDYAFKNKTTRQQQPASR